MTNSIGISLAKCPLFSGIPQDEVDRLLKISPPVIRSYHKDAILRFQGDEYCDLIIITRGEVSAEIINLDGKKIIIETLGESSALATAVLFADDNTIPVTVKANRDIELVLIPRSVIIRYCQENAVFLNNYLTDSGNKVIFLAEKIRLFKFKSITQKIAGYLLNLSKKQGTDSVRLTYTREQMADLFGVARPSLSRSFSELYDEGILKAEGKLMHILEKERLMDFITG